MPRRRWLPFTERAAEAYPRKHTQVLRVRLPQVACSILLLVLSRYRFGIMTGKRLSNFELAQLYAGAFAAVSIRGI